MDEDQAQGGGPRTPEMAGFLQRGKGAFTEKIQTGVFTTVCQASCVKHGSRPQKQEGVPQHQEQTRGQTRGQIRKQTVGIQMVTSLLSLNTQGH